ncbi:hypothetical protein FB451DRAFT_1129737 [Mycena latifolia]|nr:hypothetical protein FB451DRAFT_1129737 [Mycena latifolia]
MWLSCALCGARTARRRMSDGAFLLSYAKFLELLVYSSAVGALGEAVCVHTVPLAASSSASSQSASTAAPPADADADAALPPARLHLIRHFAYAPRKDNGKGQGKARVVSFALSEIKDVYELRVPRVRIVRGGGRASMASDARNSFASVASSTASVASSTASVASSTAVSVASMAREREVGKGKAGASARSSVASSSSAAKEGGGKEGDEEKRALRREIRAWWAGVGEYMERMETALVGSTLVGLRKALPRLPSVDDAYDDYDYDSASEGEGSQSEDGGREEEEEEPTTPKGNESATTPKGSEMPPGKGATNNSGLTPAHHPPAHGIAGLPPSAPTTPQITRSAQEFFPQAPPPPPRATSDPTSVPTLSTTSSSTPTLASLANSAPDSLALLTNLRQTFHGTEQALYAQLAQTPPSALNDVRRAFVCAARGAEKRLGAWQAKHLPAARGAGFRRSKRSGGGPRMELAAPEPEWWARGCHTAPGGSIIIREDDWGSIIAFTMSTADYARELASMSFARGASSMNSPAAAALTSASLTSATSASSFFSAPSNYKQLFAGAAQAQPDPDQEDVVWHEPEAYSAVISRKEHPRDVTSLLSIREVLRQKSPIDAAASVLPGGSRFGSLGSAATKASSGAGAPPSAWAKPDVQISRHAAGGEVSSGVAEAESAGKILQELDAVSGEGSRESSRPGSALSESFLAGALFADMHIKRGKTSSIISVSTESDATIGKGSKEDELIGHEPAAAVVTEEPQSQSQSDLRHAKAASEALSGSPTPTPSSFTNSLTSGLSSAMRYMLNNGEIPRPSMFSKNHHGLLAPADAFTAIDERPHIKYDWTIGKRLKFSCTVYYAKQFDNLRRRCGIDDVFLKSLSRSANWAAEGGKSKSNFWKTSDDRFIIKTLVNAWNVADLQVLIELAPSYFRYMDATASRATVLAKLIGFYTIEIRNLETGTVQSKADLLVMENLFYDQKIVKTFDLKGIQGRKVKSSASGPGQSVRTLFDGEWIEGQQRTLTLVRPHSKVVLREAIKSDAEFLAKSNIMDYSLLLGIDQERKQIVCGLVDTIGSYTFAKTLEYKAKQGLNSGKEVTVIPPAEYQERFVSALDGYFLACPDKWSRPMDDTKPINDPSELPSVL